MNRILFILLASSLFTTGKIFTADDLRRNITNDNQPKTTPFQFNKARPEVEVIKQETGKTSHYSLAELASQVEMLKKLVAQSRLPEMQKISVVTKFKNFGNALKKALSMGGSVVMIIAEGYILFKLCNAGYSIYKILRDDLVAPIKWALSLPSHLMPESIKNLYITHNSDNPFM